MSAKRVFVCIKQVPDTETKIKIQSNAQSIDEQGLKWIINPYDEFALEEAIKMREAGKASQVTAISIGPKARVAVTLRAALAMGADDAILIDTPSDTSLTLSAIDPVIIAKALAQAIQNAANGDNANFKIVWTGKAAIDDNQNAVPQMLAEFLKLPHATSVIKFDDQDTKSIVEREIEGGSREVVELELPAVLSATKGLNSPRYTNPMGIMKAKQKPMQEVTWDSLGLGSTQPLFIHDNLELPTEKPAVQMLAGDTATQVRELAKRLREEAKVI